MKKSLFATVTASLAILSLTGCPGGGGGGELTMSQQPSTGDGAYSVSISTVNSKDSTQWNADTNGNPYATATGVTFGGVCSRGVNKINAYVDGSTTAETAQGTCDSNGEFTQSVTFATPNSSTERAGVVHTVVFKPVLVNGAEATSGFATRTVNVDMWGPTFGSITHTHYRTTTPTATWVSSGGSSPYSLTPAAGQEGAITFKINGTVSTDAVSVTAVGTSATSITVVTPDSENGNAAGTYRLTASLSPGGTDLLSITATDKAGNSATNPSITTSYQSSFNQLAWDAAGAAVAAGLLTGSPAQLGMVGGFSSASNANHVLVFGAPGVMQKFNP